MCMCLYDVCVSMKSPKCVVDTWDFSYQLHTWDFSYSHTSSYNATPPTHNPTVNTA
jgi:hypothetical protein